MITNFDSVDCAKLKRKCQTAFGRGGPNTAIGVPAKELFAMISTIDSLRAELEYAVGSRNHWNERAERAERQLREAEVRAVPERWVGSADYRAQLEAVRETINGLFFTAGMTARGRDDGRLAKATALRLIDEILAAPQPAEAFPTPQQLLSDPISPIPPSLAACAEENVPYKYIVRFTRVHDEVVIHSDGLEKES